MKQQDDHEGGCKLAVPSEESQQVMKTDSLKY